MVQKFSSSSWKHCLDFRPWRHPMAIPGVVRCSSVLQWRTCLSKSVLCLIWHQLKAFWMEALPHADRTRPPNSWQCWWHLRSHSATSLLHHMTIQPLPTAWILLKQGPKISGLQISLRPASGLNPGMGLGLCLCNIKGVPSGIFWGTSMCCWGTVCRKGLGWGSSEGVALFCAILSLQWKPPLWILRGLFLLLSCMYCRI